VILFVDYRLSMRQTSRAQLERLWQLSQAGATVYLTTGPLGRGHQHCKSLMVDNTIAILGSTNWTHNARNNWELSACVELSPDGLEQLRTKYNFMLEWSNEINSQRFEIAHPRGATHGPRFHPSLQDEEDANDTSPRPRALSTSPRVMVRPYRPGYQLAHDRMMNQAMSSADRIPPGAGRGSGAILPSWMENRRG